MTLLHLDPDSWVPPYEQLRTQIADQTQRGVLPAGHRLPPVRRLATDLGLAPNTVARAYRELEHAGVVETRGRRGTFVLGAEPADEQAAHEAATAFAERVLALGVGPERGLELARRAFTAQAGAGVVTSGTGGPG